MIQSVLVTRSDLSDFIFLYNETRNLILTSFSSQKLLKGFRQPATNHFHIHIYMAGIATS